MRRNSVSSQHRRESISFVKEVSGAMIQQTKNEIKVINQSGAAQIVYGEALSSHLLRLNIR